jgi:hypothetical protein
MPWIKIPHVPPIIKGGTSRQVCAYESLPGNAFSDAPTCLRKPVEPRSFVPYDSSELANMYPTP